MTKINITWTQITLALLLLSPALTIQAVFSPGHEYETSSRVDTQKHHHEIQNNLYSFANTTQSTKNVFRRNRPHRRVTQRITSFLYLSAPPPPKLVQLDTFRPGETPGSLISRANLISPPQTAPPA